MMRRLVSTTLRPARAAVLRQRWMSTFKDEYDAIVVERKGMGVVPEPLKAEQVSQLCGLLEDPPAGEEDFLVDLIESRVPPGVDEAAYVKAAWLSALAEGKAASPLISKVRAVELLGTMQGGYNIDAMVAALEDDDLAEAAVEGLSKTLLMFDAFYDVEEKGKAGNVHAQKVMQSWADAEWFTSRDKVAEKISVTVFKVTGETNTDDLSPAPDAWSRPDIPLHALAMLKMERDGIVPEVEGAVGPLKLYEELQAKGYVGWRETGWREMRRVERERRYVGWRERRERGRGEMGEGRRGRGRARVRVCMGVGAWEF